MRVVVVGASGNVGTSLIQSLAREKEITSVVGLARRLPEWRAAKTEWQAADIAYDDMAAHFQGADAVVHLAWLFQPTHSPLITWRNNVLGSLRVFRAAAEARVPSLVYASSVAAYSPGPERQPVDESWPTHGWPMAAYSREKAYVERALDAIEHEFPDQRVVRLRSGFIFKQASATAQRRLFAGPFLPGRLVRPGLVPVLPRLPGLRFQALHSLDAGEACRQALVRPVRGAFNIAADPVLDVERLAPLLRARTAPVPAGPLRAALAAAWHLHLAPASPYLLDAVLQLPIMDTTRAREELGFSPVHSGVEAVEEFLQGLRTGTGMSTPPLDPQAGGRMREREITTGVGERP